MYGEIDIASIEATLGVREWTDEEELDMTFLADKMCGVELTHKEQIEYEALQALYISGR